MRPSSVLRVVGIAIVVALGGCGDSASETAPTKVIQKKESEALKREGTAASPEELQRREEEQKEALARKAAVDELKKYSANLRQAKDSMDITEAIMEIASVGKYAEPMLDDVDKFLKHEDSDVRIAVYRAHGRVHGDQARDLIAKALQDDEPEVRAAGAEIWRSAKINSLIPIMPLLEDFDSSVQYQAMKTVAASDPKVGEILEIVRLFPEMDGPAAKEALRLLVEKKDSVPDLDATLIAAMDHNDPSLRLQAVRASGAVIAKRLAIVTQLVRNLGDDPDEHVRRESHELLKAWGGADAPAYDPKAEDAARSAAAAAWKTWLARNGARFQS